jgi:hypothetical protein
MYILDDINSTKCITTSFEFLGTYGAPSPQKTFSALAVAHMLSREFRYWFKQIYKEQAQRVQTTFAYVQYPINQ